MRYDFLVDTYDTERLKVLSVWSEFTDEDLPVRPSRTDKRGRSVHEHMVHQCVSENTWFVNMLGMEVGAPPLPDPETRLSFIRRYAEDSTKRLQVLQSKEDPWWEAETKFFHVVRSRAWVMTRRIAHTSHHRGQLMALLRTLGRDLIATMAQPPIPGIKETTRRRFTLIPPWTHCSQAKLRAEENRSYLEREKEP